MKLVKQAMYKLIVLFCIFMIFCTFLASTPVEASGKVSTEFYYSGTTKGSYVVEKGFLEKLVDALSAILDYLLGLLTMGLRMVFVGWTALLERVLTAVIMSASGEGDQVNLFAASPTSVSTNDQWITIDAIFFNRIPLLDVNFFKDDISDKYDAMGKEKEEDTTGGTSDPKSSTTPTATTDPDDDDNKSLITIVKEAIAEWYYILRVISFMVMLVILVYIGVKLAISSATKEKALYKRVLLDWIVGMVLVFSIHYIMLLIIGTNEILVDALATRREGAKELKVYEYGLEERAKKPIANDELEVNLYDEVKTRAYDAKLTVGTTGMIMYMVLVFYAWKYTFIYLKRYLTVAVLTIIAPLVAATYAFNKVNTGKSTVFTNWFKEYLCTVIIQTVHAILYLVFLDTALKIALNSVGSIILVFVLMHMMTKCEELFRKILGINGKLTDEIAKASIKDTMNSYKAGMTAVAGGKMGINAAKSFMGKSTRALTAPLKKAGDLTVGNAFTGIMKHRAKKLDSRSDAEKDAENDKKQSDLEGIKKASIAHAINNGSIDVGKLREAVDSLQVGQDIVDDEGRKIGKVTQEYIDQEKKAMAEIEEADKDKEELEKAYIKNTKKSTLAKKHISEKWKEIMDPNQYLKKVAVKDKDGKVVRDENGNIVYKYKKLEKKRENSEYESPLGKAIFGGKVTDSSTKRFRNNLKISNLRDLSEEQKKRLDINMKLAKRGITGFFGIMAGIPLLVAEPAVGAALLYKGVSQTHEMDNAIRRPLKKQKITVKAFNSMDPKSRYILTGFAGGSIDTIANTAQSEARREMGEIEDGYADYNKELTKRLKKKRKKLVQKIKEESDNSTEGRLHNISDLSRSGNYSVKPGTVSATRQFAKSSKKNKYVKFRTLGLEARKHSAEKYINAEELGDLYIQSETDKVITKLNEGGKEIDKLSDKFVEGYAAYLATERKRIDNLSDEELLVENDFEDPVEFQDTGSSHNKLSGDSERSLIDNAIIDVAMKMGVVDLSQLEKSEILIKSIEKQMENESKKRGIIGKNDSIDSIIDNSDKKIKDRIETLAKGGTKPVQDKLIDQSFAEVMRKGDKDGKTITDPDKVDTKAVEEVYLEKYGKIAGVKPTEETTKVVSSISEKDPQGSSTNTGTTSPIQESKESRMQAIVARKAIISEKISKPITKKDSDKLKAQKKRETEFDLDAAIIEREVAEESEEITPEEMAASAKATEDVVKLLSIQTEMHKKKASLDSYMQRRTSTMSDGTKKRLEMSLEDLNRNDSSRVKVSNEKDGSRRVVAKNSDIELLLKRSKSII